MYTNDDIAILYLDSLGLSRKAISDVLKQLKTPADIFGSGLKNAKLAELLPKGSLERIANLGKDKIEQFVLADLDKYGIYAITYLNNLYPKQLLNIADYPFVLYTKGDVGVLKQPSIGVVGTRTPTNYGREITEKFTKELCASGLVITSGLSYGVDTAAAATALASNGKTIAVLAGGLDNIYPAQNVGLSNQIADNGLLVSEYRPGVRPRTYSFIARNRIISGLSQGVLVVEAGIKSGAASTAMFAVEQGRELFVVPGNITSPQSAGCNKLISEMPDCFTISPRQITDRLGLKPSVKANKPAAQLDIISSNIVNAMGSEEVHFDQILEAVNMSASALASSLSMLEIMGIVKKLPGNYYKVISQ